MSAPNVKHPGLSSTFTGVYPQSSDGQVSQFRGIKYGSIPARFTQATLNEAFPAEYNATAYGPKCPYVNYPTRMEDALIGISSGFARHADDIFDEFNCLNLNITVPAKSDRSSKLPVLLYIHGGGSHSGSNSDWWSDGTSLVRQSIKLGKPVIMVAINYRLAVLGWIGSSELKAELGNANGGNYGLRDQHTAIEWVSRHIGPFGGDPSNITIYGESAGALGVHSQLCSLLPSYFSRGIMQSMTLGTPVFSTPQTIAEKTWVYEKVKEVLKVTTVKELQEAPWQDLLRAYDTSDPRHGFGEVGMIDDEFYSASFRDRLEFANGKGELLIGTTGDEATVTEIVLLQYPKTEIKPTTQSLIDTLKTLVPAAKIDALLAAYDITPATPSPEAAKSLLALFADFMFYAPANWIAGHAATRHGVRVLEYGFQQVQPFGGIFKGKASHSLDLAYLHGNPAIFAGLPTADQELRVQEAVQETWIDFARGEAGWGAFEEEAVKVFGPAGAVAEVSKDLFLTDLRRGKAWEPLGAFEAREMEIICPVIVGHVGRLMGSA